MFDKVPVRVWLLIAIAAIAWVPARYIYRYFAYSPSRCDITQAPQHLDWRTGNRFAINLLILGTLAGLAIFIFTPAAAEFAHSPNFYPLVLAGVGGWALLSVPRGLSTGQIELFIRGGGTYQREGQPKRFWASVVWNTLLGGLCLWGAFFTIRDSTEQQLGDQCYNRGDTSSLQDQLAACSRLIPQQRDAQERADLLVSRGIAYDRLRDHEHAMADYSEAIRLNPRNAAAYYDRALGYQMGGENDAALADFNAALRLRPDYVRALLARGSSYEHMGRLDQAIADFNEVIRLRPNWPAGYYYRGWAYRDRGDEDQAEADLAAAVRLRQSEGTSKGG